jgi:hypothetical protein
VNGRLSFSLSTPFSILGIDLYIAVFILPINSPIFYLPDFQFGIMAFLGIFSSRHLCFTGRKGNKELMEI